MWNCVFVDRGGLLSGGNTTLLIGTERPEEAIGAIGRSCEVRREMVNTASLGVRERLLAPSGGQKGVEVPIGGAVVFVFGIEQFGRYDLEQLEVSEEEGL